MRDVVSIERANKLHPAIRQEVIDTITKIENESFPSTIRIRIVQGLRTIEEQNELYAQGRTRPGSIVTNAKGGSSYHNYGLAFDFVIMYDKDNNGSYEAVSWDVNYDFDKDGVKDWQEVVKAFKALGYTWGGDFKSIVDSPHIEKTFGHNWRDLLVKYNNKDFISTTSYVML
ncbi:MAG TPA: M15 family metallopeptidase [Chitinophagaceae bacterium]|nr:M15 family metallopeptidase [Chitinophagaceae bacterium]